MPPSLREGDHDSGGRSQFASISEGVDQIVVEGVYSLSHFVTAPLFRKRSTKLFVVNILLIVSEVNAVYSFSNSSVTS